MVIFTEEELGTFKREQLRRLADYYHVVYNISTKKSELIQLLAAVLSQPGEYPTTEEIEPPMSVRVRRLRTQNKEG